MRSLKLAISFTVFATIQCQRVSSAGGGVTQRPVIDLQSQRPPVARVNQPFSFSLLPDTFISPPGVRLTYSATPLPPWASFDPFTRTFSGTPKSTDLGSTLVSVIADGSDGSKLTSDGFQLLVTNDPVPRINVPLSSQTPNATVRGGGSFLQRDGTIRVPPRWSFSLGFVEDTFVAGGGGSRVFYSASNRGSTSLPSWLRFDNTTVTFSGVAPDRGSFIVDLVGSDHFGYGDVKQSFALVVSSRPFEMVSPLPPIALTARGVVEYTIPTNGLRVDNSPVTPSEISARVDLSGCPYLSYDGSSRHISGVLPASIPRSTNLTIPIILTNSFNDTLPTNLLLEILPDLLTLSRLPDLEVQPGEQFFFDLLPFVTSLDGVYKATFDPVSATFWMLFNSTDLSLRGTFPRNAPNVTVHFSASDPLTGVTDTASMFVLLASTDGLPSAPPSSEDGTGGGGLSTGGKVLIGVATGIVGAVILILLFVVYGRPYFSKRRQSRNSLVIGRPLQQSPTQEKSPGPEVAPRRSEDEPADSTVTLANYRVRRESRPRQLGVMSVFGPDVISSPEVVTRDGPASRLPRPRSSDSDSLEISYDTNPRTGRDTDGDVAEQECARSRAVQESWESSSIWNTDQEPEDDGDDEGGEENRPRSSFGRDIDDYYARSPLPRMEEGVEGSRSSLDRALDSYQAGLPTTFGSDGVIGSSQVDNRNSNFFPNNSLEILPSSSRAGERTPTRTRSDDSLQLDRSPRHVDDNKYPGPNGLPLQSTPRRRSPPRRRGDFEPPSPHLPVPRTTTGYRRRSSALSGDPANPDGSRIPSASTETPSRRASAAINRALRRRSDLLPDLRTGTNHPHSPPESDDEGNIPTTSRTSGAMLAYRDQSSPSPGASRRLSEGYVGPRRVLSVDGDSPTAVRRRSQSGQSILVSAGPSQARTTSRESIASSGARNAARTLVQIEGAGVRGPSPRSSNGTSRLTSARHETPPRQRTGVDPRLRSSISVSPPPIRPDGRPVFRNWNPEAAAGDDALAASPASNPVSPAVISTANVRRLRPDDDSLPRPKFINFSASRQVSRSTTRSTQASSAADIVDGGAGLGGFAEPANSPVRPSEYIRPRSPPSNNDPDSPSQVSVFSSDPENGQHLPLMIPSPMFFEGEDELFFEGDNALLIEGDGEDLMVLGIGGFNDHWPTPYSNPGTSRRAPNAGRNGEPSRIPVSVGQSFHYIPVLNPAPAAVTSVPGGLGQGPRTTYIAVTDTPDNPETDRQSLPQWLHFDLSELRFWGVAGPQDCGILHVQVIQRRHVESSQHRSQPQCGGSRYSEDGASIRRTSEDSDRELPEQVVARFILDIQPLDAARTDDRVYEDEDER